MSKAAIKKLKNLSDLMHDLGFREDATVGAKEAFLKNLIRSTTGASIETPSEKALKKTEELLKSLGIEKKLEDSQDLQLSFAGFEKTVKNKKDHVA